MIVIQDEFKQGLKQDEDFFNQIMQIQGNIYRALENRRTLQFIHNGKSYFIKQHFGIGWKEIFKNLFQFRLPIVSAKNEWQAILKLNSLNIPTLSLVAYGERGFNPACKQSFMVTEALENVVSLEVLCKNWSTKKPSFRFKQALIREVATIAKIMHQHGLNHRDFYICHFLIKKNEIENLLLDPAVIVTPRLDRGARDDNDLGANDLHLILIDLHRTQIREIVPLRWQIKDIAGLYFSSMDAGLTRRDIFRFLSIYFEIPWVEVLKQKEGFLNKVMNRALKLYHKTFKRLPKGY